MKSHAGIGDWIIASYEKEVPFLQQIPRESADFFLLNSQIKEYEAGQVIISGDADGSSFCVLQSGRAKICGKVLPDGRHNVLAWLESGACFGEMSIICNEKTSNTVIAAEDCTVLHLGRESFIKFLENNPSMMVFLYKVSADRLRTKNQAFDEFQRLDVVASAKVLPFIDFAQTLEKSHITGIVSCECDGEAGSVAFWEGRICCAECGQLEGEEALERILSWGDDTFFKLDRHKNPDKANINQQADTTSLILDALRNLDEKQSQEKKA
jgi:CRP-like cAMP-binding protein